MNQRLSTAVEEVFHLLETTIAEYEREIERQRKLLEGMARPEGQVNKAGEWRNVPALSFNEVIGCHSLVNWQLLNLRNVVRSKTSTLTFSVRVSRP